MEAEEAKKGLAGTNTANTPVYKWYVIHTYSGYENKVKSTLDRKIASLGMEEEVRQTLIPMEDEIDEKNGVKKIVKRKVFPGYVLVEMKLEEQKVEGGGSFMKINPQSWYVVRNTPGVTGFVGSATEPVPLSDAEVEQILKTQGIYTIDIEVNDNVRITSDTLKDMIGRVTEVDLEKGKVTVMVEMFNRDTPVELAFSEIEKL